MSDYPFMRRVFGPLKHDTFAIPAVSDLLDRYVPKDGKRWADPFARNTQRAEFTNDWDPDTSAKSHLDAQVFVRRLPRLDGALFDPPYSYRQITEHYRAVGRCATALDTSSNFYVRVRVPLCRKVRVGGLFVHFGWNTTGPGDKERWEFVEGLDIAHGSHHNDTLVGVWRKVRR
jgi:hypothetical protein